MFTATNYEQEERKECARPPEEVGENKHFLYVIGANIPMKKEVIKPSFCGLFSTKKLTLEEHYPYRKLLWYFFESIGDAPVFAIQNLADAKRLAEELTVGGPKAAVYSKPAIYMIATAQPSASYPRRYFPQKACKVYEVPQADITIQSAYLETTTQSFHVTMAMESIRRIGV